MSRSRFDRSNIRHEIKERDRLYKEMTDLSVRTMGADIFGDGKNQDQIVAVTDSLGNLQSLRETLESPTLDDALDAGEIEFTKAILEERAQEFKEKAKICLASYNASSRPVVLEYLKEMKRLYDVSYIRVNELFNQKAQALQADQKHRNGATRVSSEVTRRDFEKLEVGLTGSIGKHVKNLTIELNDGTPSTPGQHIRISGDHNVQTALKNAIQAAGLTIEEKVKGITPIVVVRLTEPLNSAVLVKIRENFQREMRQIGRAMPNPQARAENVEMRRPAGIDAEMHRLPPSDFDHNAEYRNYLRRVVVGFNMHPEFTAEINAGTESTPGEHLRFSALPGAHYELTALKTALDETGISYEEKAKGVGNTERMLIIRQMPLLRPGFEAQFKQHYVAALKKIAAEAKAIRASQARSPQQLKHEEAARKISSDIQASYDRLDELSKKYEGSFSTPSFPAKVTFMDEFFYLSEEILDQIDAELDNMKQLEESLQTELALSGMPTSQQKEMLQSAQNKIQEVEAQSIEARSGIEPTKELLAQAYNIPLPVKAPAEQPKHRQRTQDPETEAVAAEKKELLTEIKRIKAEIHNMVENLTNEIPKAMFSKGLKTEKRNTLLSLSRNLYVSDKSSLAELRECADKFRGELAKCQTDAILRQGTFRRKNCRILIDKLAQDVESEQHVFKRPK